MYSATSFNWIFLKMWRTGVFWRYVLQINECCGHWVTLTYFSAQVSIKDHYGPLVNFNRLFVHEYYECVGSSYLVSATPPTVLLQFFWNLTCVLIMVWSSVCAFLVKKSWNYFSPRFHIFNLIDFFYGGLLWKCIGSRYLVSTIYPTVLHQFFWNFTGIWITVYMVWICMRVGHYYQIFFFFFFSHCNLGILLTGHFWRILKGKGHKFSELAC